MLPFFILDNSRLPRPLLNPHSFTPLFRTGFLKCARHPQKWFYISRFVFSFLLKMKIIFITLNHQLVFGFFLIKKEHPMQRRDFLKSMALTSLAVSTIKLNDLFAGTAAQGVGMCDWNLGQSCDPELIPKAAEATLRGIQVSVGRAPDVMPVREKSVRARYIELGKKHNITFHSVAAGSILNNIPLASEPQSAV